ncbi:Serine protease [Phytophthora cactorum]|nr:Serine protease [Phytophthora cactorum]
MKPANAVAVFAAVIAVIASPIGAYQGHVERELILGGEIVPSGTKTYVANIRLHQDSDSAFGGSLISPTHVLTASHCTVNAPHWVAIGEHYRNGTEVGEVIKIVSMMNHPNYSENIPNSDDFMIVELERPSKFKPVKLAAADDSDFKPGTMATTMGGGQMQRRTGIFLLLPPPLLTVRSDMGEDPVDSLYNITNPSASEQWPAALRMGSEAARQQETRKFFDELDAMELKLVVGMKRKEKVDGDGMEEKLYQWTVVMRYDLLNQGHLEVTMNYDLIHVPLLEGEKRSEAEDMPPVLLDTSAMFNWVTLMVVVLYQVSCEHTVSYSRTHLAARFTTSDAVSRWCFAHLRWFCAVRNGHVGAKVPRFQSASSTATTLFSVANGDEIHDTFNDVAYTPWIGQIYVYSYMILFSYVVLMVCIGIIEDAFFSAVFPASWPTLDETQHEGQRTSGAGYHHPQSVH